MARNHNKKRNVGLIYEQLVRQLSICIIEKDEKKLKTVQGILTKHFKPGTELYQEFRLFNALAKTTLPSESLATRVLGEARRAARGSNSKNLSCEKSALIKEINHSLNDPTFYNQKIPAYREYATIQVLLNDWRKNGDIKRIAEYEAKVHNMLLEEKKNSSLDDESNSSVNRLTVRLMLEKFNKKYNVFLNEEQTKIIKNYVFFTDEEMNSYLEGLKVTTIAELHKYRKKCENQVLLEKIDKVIENITFLNESKAEDDSIAKFLLISKLKEEIKETDNA